MWLIFVVSLISLTHWPSDNDVLDPEVQASVDFAAQERRATPPEGQLVFFVLLQFSLSFFRFIDWAPPASPEGQLVTFFVLFFALTIFFVFPFHLFELLNEKIESRKFQIVLQPKLVISIFYLVSVFVLMISILIVSVIRDFTNFSFTWLRFSMRKEILTSLRWFLGIPPMSIRQRENLSITKTVSPTRFSLYFTFIVLHVR